MEQTQFSKNILFLHWINNSENINQNYLSDHSNSNTHILLLMKLCLEQYLHKCHFPQNFILPKFWHFDIYSIDALWFFLLTLWWYFVDISNLFLNTSRKGSPNDKMNGPIKLSLVILINQFLRRLVKHTWWLVLGLSWEPLNDFTIEYLC